MRVSQGGLIWAAYLIVALVLLEFLAGPWYPVVVGLGGLGLALIVPPPVAPRYRIVGHDVGRLVALYVACVALFYLAFQIFTVGNVIGLFFAYAAALLLGFGGPLVHVAIGQRRPLADLGLTRERLPETLGLAVVLAGIQAALTFPKVQLGTPDTWIPLLGMALAVGAFEAIFFRAYVIAILEPMVGTVGAVIASAGMYALYHIGYGMSPSEMVFLFGLGIVYVVAYLAVRNILAIWPLLTPLGGFFNTVSGGDIEMPLIAVLGFLNILGLMAAIVFLVHRWQRSHPLVFNAGAGAR